MKTPKFQYRVSYHNAAQGGRRTESRHRTMEAANRAAEKLARAIRNDGYAHSYTAEFWDSEDGWMIA